MLTVTTSPIAQFAGSPTRTSSPRFAANESSEKAMLAVTKADQISAKTRIAGSILGPATGFFLDEFVGDQLHQHRALKDAYEILRPKDLAKISFDQIIGQEAAKQELQEFIKRQKFSQLFKYLYEGDERGANNAILLTGPPGTGKTLLAKAVAANLEDAAMVNIHCETLTRMIQQRNAARKFEKRLRAIPQKRIVLMFDEMEAVGNRNLMNPTQDEYKLLTWLLKLIDGIKTKKGQETLIIGTTNFLENLDPAIRNRFQQIIPVQAPNDEELKQLFNLYLNKDEKRLRAEGPLDMEAIAQAAKGFTGRKVEQTVSILKRHLLMNLPDEEKTRLNQQIVEYQKQKGLKNKKPLDIKLTYTQADVLNAIRMARSSLDITQTESAAFA
jgi:AAA+ superfamily predicted ATPase